MIVSKSPRNREFPLRPSRAREGEKIYKDKSEPAIPEFGISVWVCGWLVCYEVEVKEEEEGISAVLSTWEAEWSVIEGDKWREEAWKSVIILIVIKECVKIQSI